MKKKIILIIIIVAVIVLTITLIRFLFCRFYHYGDCPFYCVEKCMPSDCNYGEIIPGYFGIACTADCGGPGSCTYK